MTVDEATVILPPVKTKSCYQELSIHQLKNRADQPRREFDPVQLQSLADSITANGIIEPILVRKSWGGQYEIIAGERRWRAAGLAQLETIPCIIRDCTDQEMAQIAIVENLQREALNSIELASALKKLMDEQQCTVEQLAAIVGKERSTVSNWLRLLQFEPRIKELIISGQLSEGRARRILAIPTLHQYRFADQCIKSGWSIKTLEQEIKKFTEPKNKSNKETKKDVNITSLERQLSDSINCTVQIDNKKNNRGCVKIYYSNLDVLDGILEKMNIKNL